MVPRLEVLLNRIAVEFLQPELSKNEIEYFEKLKWLKHRNRREYITYVRAYNELIESKEQDEAE